MSHDRASAVDRFMNPRFAVVQLLNTYCIAAGSLSSNGAVQLGGQPYDWPVVTMSRCSAEAATNGLYVEPGGYWPWIARFSSG